MGIEVLGSIGSAIVNEGPVAPRFLENTMPLVIGKLNPIKEIRFNEHLTVPSVIAEAEAILAQVGKPVALPSVILANAGIQLNTSSSELDPRRSLPRTTIRGGDDKKVEPQVFLPIEPVEMSLAAPNIVEYPRPHMAVSPAWEVQPALQQKTESRVSIQTTTATPTLPALKKQEVEEIVTEKVIKKETGLIEEEEITKEKRLYLVDENALTQRIHEIRQAVNKARIEAKRLGLGESINGLLIAKFMPAEHVGNRSRIVQPNGPDGSYEETKEAVRIGQFYSEDQVEDVVLENRPVKIGKDGKPVKNEDVWKVLKYRVFKRILAHEVVISRVMKKKSSSGQNPTQIQVRDESKIEPRETSLEDYPELAEIFQD